MLISEMLKNQGLFSKDIKGLFKTNKIIYNGETIKEDIDIKNIISIEKLEGFLRQVFNNDEWMVLIKLLGLSNLENIRNSNIKSDLVQYLNNYNFLRYGKNDKILVIKIINE